MTRLLACGDLHIGAGLDYSDDRIGDQAKVLDEIAEIAYERGVDGVLIAGDIFHRAAPPVRGLHALRDWLVGLARNDINVVAITGNKIHDVVNGSERCALELFHDGDRIRVLRQPDIVRIAGAAIACLPNVPVDRLVAVHGGRLDADVNAHAVAILVEQAAELRALLDGWLGPKVLLGHWAVTGATLPNGLPTDTLGEPVLPIDALEQQGWDQIVLGHIHQPQHVGATALYTGSPAVVDFGEAHVDHGVWIVDLAADDVHREFVQTHDRPFLTLDFDHEDPVAQIALTESIGWDVADAVIRIRIRCTDEQARRLDQPTLRRALYAAGAHNVWQIAVDRVDQRQARVEGVDETLTPMEALQMWGAANQIAPTDLEQLGALTNSYLAEVTS